MTAQGIRILSAAFLLLGGLVAPQLVQAQSQAGDEIVTYLDEIVQITREAHEVSQSAEQANSVAEVKRNADRVFEAVWGVPSGISEENARGAAFMHGWRTRWQTDATEFDSTFVARYGSHPPEIEDPRALGIIGRGRHVRKLIDSLDADENASAGRRIAARRVVASLNNVIGWMKMDSGVTKGELQPRVDLTREWDSPSHFWNTTADTGWLFEAFSQATNILKTDYEGDADAAREHAAVMTRLLERALDGVDENGNGTVEPRKMEGGLVVARQQAEQAGWVTEAAR